MISLQVNILPPPHNHHSAAHPGCPHLTSASFSARLSIGATGARETGKVQQVVGDVPFAMLIRFNRERLFFFQEWGGFKSEMLLDLHGPP